MKRLSGLLFMLMAPAWAGNLGPTSVPRGWRYNDLAKLPAVALALGGARATLTLEPSESQAPATVRVYRTKLQKSRWSDDAKVWTERLVGSHRVIVKTPARLERRDGVRMYTIETQSDGDGDLQLYTSLLAMEVSEVEGTRLVLLSFEESQDAYLKTQPAVQALFATIKPFAL